MGQFTVVFGKIHLRFCLDRPFRAMCRFNSGILLTLWKRFNQDSSNCRASKIILNGAKFEPISWEPKRGNPPSNLCVGVSVVYFELDSEQAWDTRCIPEVSILLSQASKIAIPAVNILNQNILCLIGCPKSEFNIFQYSWEFSWKIMRIVRCFNIS